MDGAEVLKIIRRIRRNVAVVATDECAIFDAVTENAPRTRWFASRVIRTWNVRAGSCIRSCAGRARFVLCNTAQECLRIRATLVRAVVDAHGFRAGGARAAGEQEHESSAHDAISGTLSESGPPRRAEPGACRGPRWRSDSEHTGPRSGFHAGGISHDSAHVGAWRRERAERTILDNPPTHAPSASGGNQFWRA